ncbi:MAG: dihydroorotate dehydrogenase (quinone), partial [Oceanococcaceae bacterium]
MSVFTLSQKLLFSLDAESAHVVTVRALRHFPRINSALIGQRLDCPAEVMGLSFANPIGVAAGLDKNGECIAGLFGLGFGFVEVGTTTPRAQPGNPKPRVFRLEEDQAIINRLGFNNRGVSYLCRQVARARRCGHVSGPLGINIGKNAATPMERAVDDYLYCLERVYPLADYITVNISSPNTQNLRDLQSPEALERFVGRIVERGAQLGGRHGRRPIALKISPDNTPDQLVAMARILRESGIDAVIATNTTVSRPPLIDSRQAS